jgi:hypothetical protein
MPGSPGWLDLKHHPDILAPVNLDFRQTFRQTGFDLENPRTASGRRNPLCSRKS